MGRVVIVFCLYATLIDELNAGLYNGLEHLVYRPRPFGEQQETTALRLPSTGVSGFPKNGSFPSGHACNAFMISVLFADRFRRKRYVFYCLAVLVAFSRVYLGVDYPGDVIAGGVLGWAVTWLMLTFRPARNTTV